MLRRIDPSLYRQPVDAADPTVTLRYLGTAGFTLASAQRTIVIDPFVTRPGLLRTGLRRLVPDAEKIAQIIPHADDVIVGHAHHDHVLDSPQLCHQTGARFIGSPSACNVARAAGLPEAQIRATEGRERIACGSASVYGAPSRHGRVYFGRVTLPGVITAPPPWPPRVWDLPHGLVLNWHIEIGGLSIFHVDSAEILVEELEGLSADVVCLCAIGRRYRPNYVADAVRILKPRYVVACHWDWFFTPLEAHPVLLPGVDLPGFVAEVEAAGAEPVIMPFQGALRL
ncbi:MAG: MBL fold metallo-hydrolase [Myxococcota bacterium]|nr:MBL fold metallo-hydrolase [Myxococcota bacterium]